VVDQLEDEAQYGYGGILMLLEKMKNAAANPVELQRLIQDFGLVV
jgi:hypothetical protein